MYESRKDLLVLQSRQRRSRVEEPKARKFAMYIVIRCARIVCVAIDSFAVGDMVRAQCEFGQSTKGKDVREEDGEISRPLVWCD